MILNPGIYWKQGLESMKRKMVQHAIRNSPQAPEYLSSCQANFRAALAWKWQQQWYAEQKPTCRKLRLYIENNLTPLAIPVEVMFWPSVAGFVPISQINVIECRRMISDIFRSLVPRRITSDSDGVRGLIPPNVVNIHRRGKDELAKIDASPSRTEPEVEYNSHRLFADNPAIDISVRTKSIAVYHVGNIVSHEPGNLAGWAYAWCIFESILLVLCSVVPIIVQYCLSRNCLLVRTATIRIHLREIRVGNSKEVIIRLIPDVVRSKLIGLCYDADFQIGIGGCLENIDLRGASSSAGRWVIFAFADARWELLSKEIRSTVRHALIRRDAGITRVVGVWPNSVGRGSEAWSA